MKRPLTEPESDEDHLTEQNQMGLTAETANASRVGEEEEGGQQQRAAKQRKPNAASFPPDHFLRLDQSIRSGVNPITIENGVECMRLFKLSPLLMTGGRLLIRNEYRELWNDVKKLHSKPIEHGLTICGQPGVGKSLALLYLLAQGLVLRQDPNHPEADNLIMVFCISPSSFIVFDEEGARLCTMDNHPWPRRNVPRNVIVLVDSDTNLETPPDLFTNMASECLVIQASSPNPRRYKEWLKYFTPPGQIWFMDIWTEEEMHQLGKLLYPRTIEPNELTIEELFHLTGPSARTMLSIHTQESLDTAYTYTFELEDLIKFHEVIRSGNAGQEPPHFHDVFFAKRKPGAPRLGRGRSISGLATYFIPTQYLRNCAFRSFQRKSLAEQIKLVRHFKLVPQISAPLVETLILDAVSHGEHPLKLDYYLGPDAQQALHLPTVVDRAHLPTSPPQNLPSRQFWLPPNNFTTIDGALSLNHGRHIILIQVTIAHQHNIAPEGITEILTLFPELGNDPAAIRFEFIFVVLQEEFGKAMVRSRNGNYSARIPASIKTSNTRSAARVEIPVGYAVISPKVQKEWGMDEFPKLEMPK